MREALSINGGARYQSNAQASGGAQDQNNVQASGGAPAGEVGHMQMNTSHEDHMDLAFRLGLLANILSVLGLLSSIRTVYTISKKKPSDGYPSIPYAAAILNASLLLYYGILKTNAVIISVNAIVIVIEITFLVLFLIYASTEEKALKAGFRGGKLLSQLVAYFDLQMYTARLLLLLNVGGFGVMMALTILLLKGQQRINVVGWICMAINLVMLAVPLRIMWRVIKTKTVEFMPFTPSLFLTLSALAWFLYGLLVKDLKIAIPNMLGLLLGIAQMILYMIYKGENKKMAETNERHNQQEVSLDMKKLTSTQSAKLYPASQHQPKVTEMDIFPSGKSIEPNNNV